MKIRKLIHFSVNSGKMYLACSMVLAAAVTTALELKGYLFISLVLLIIFLLIYWKDAFSIAKDLIKALKEKIKSKH